LSALNQQQSARRERRFIDASGKEFRDAVVIDPATGVEAIAVVGVVPRPVYIPVPVPMQPAQPAVSAPQEYYYGPSPAAASSIPPYYYLPQSSHY